jgi:predicted AlkP superfamily phosphohydrolase/phosphomutase
LDGATFDIINPLVASGRMPVLARMMREGSHAPLRSTILPNSFPGWASCTTGTSEGMHGVFSPFIKNPGSYSVRAMSGRDILTRHVWDFLGQQQGRSLVLNVPTTYPPEPINGLMVTGMLTPNRDVEFTHPASLKAELLAEVPGYIIEPERIPDKRARAAEFRLAIEMTGRALDLMLKKGDWDFLMVVFSVLDRAQHDYWADRDPSHPRHDPQAPAEFRGFIDEIYERLDEQVGRLVEKLPSQCRTFVVSDHGFCAELYEVRVNEALSQAGLLSFKASVSRKQRAQLRSLKEKVSRRLSPTRPAGNVLEKKVKYGSAFLDEIDWTRTRAFFAQDKGVWVNLAGREPEGIVTHSSFESVVTEARQALSEIKGPDGSPAFESVIDRSEAFNGRGSERLPDLVMIPGRDEIVYNERPSYGEVVVPADSTTGTHSRDGILIAWGSGIDTQAHFVRKPNLRDIGPTALASLGCPLSEDMDGRPIEEVFVGGVEVKRQGSSYRDGRASSDAVYSIGEESQLRERLRGLGYIE